MSTINLDGGEVTIIRALGFSGTSILGRDLKGAVGGMSEADLVDTLKTLTVLGYVNSSVDLDREEEIDKIGFAVNPGYSKALREAINPEPQPSKRQRRI